MLTKIDRMIRTIHQLTPRELDRLLVSYRLAPATAEVLRLGLWEVEDYLDEIRAEQRCGGGRVAPKSAWQLYRERNPVHGPKYVPPCRGCGFAYEACDCDVPF